MSSSLGLVPGLEGDTLMAQMQKLFEPPGKAAPLKVEQESTSELHPYFKRPGKGHNHDCCDSCFEGGALICCDSCPSSFHLQCHDPPLEDDDIPEGDWICIKCFASKPENQKLVANAKKKEKSPLKIKILKQPPPDEVPLKSPEKGVPNVKVPGDRDWRPGGKGKKVEIGKPVRTTRTLMKKMYADNSTEDEECEFEHFNPQELEPVAPPRKRGTYKELYIQHLKFKPEVTFQPFSLLLQAASNHNAHEFELPHSLNLPERFPYSWKWSSAEKRKKMLLDEEPEPRGQVTMCHVCVKSSRVGPLVRCDYCPLSFHLDCLDPPISEVPRDVWMCPNHVEQFLDNKVLSSTSITERVALWDKFAKQPIDTNAVKLQFMKRCQRKTDRFKRKVKTTAQFKVKVPNYVQSQYKQPPSLLPGPAYERWVDPTQRRLDLNTGCLAGTEEGKEMEWVSGLVSLQTAILREKLVEEVDSRERELKKRKENPTERVEPVPDMENNIDECPKVEADTDSKDSETQNSDDVNANDLKDRLCEISVKVEADLSTNNGCSPASTLSTCSLSPRHTRDLSSHPTLATQLAEYLAEHSTHPISALDPMVVQYLAHRQLQTLLPTPTVSVADVQARASLTPLHSRRQPAYMQYRSLSVGVGGGAGLDLARYGHCNYLSARHATIFYDELSAQYELINYSQHGTMVDEVLYSLDTMGVAARYPEYKAKNPVEVMARRVGEKTVGGCYCEGEGRSGCEGSALLHHGSLVQFGCLQFVFSVASEEMDTVEM
eukprot:TRINITY_DN29443_c0_g1_i1.p1 TRINITY_DN29443_c0_g1~~TRINITY_DN29443_c0_g1_i1.p1  ORF type:complete len:772 (+),score=286.60 TRINITY_DN29443_c0_g1_i1:49-2364(+)